MDSQGTVRIYEKAGFGRRVPRGRKPAILVVDFSYGFTDASYPTAADMSAQVLATRRLLDAGRRRAVPIAFTTICYDEGQVRALAWLRKAPGMAALRHGTRLVEIDDRLGRQEQEPLLVKAGASAFFGTSLASLVASWHADTLVVTGATTSGCIRASVVDAVQHGYDVLVPEECVADRASAPHHANLFDIDQKYADVIPLEEVLRYIETV
ncbi:isochorismatase family protein [Hypericibacter sp.]|uniref:isochorismatase family protein n=1 Tax=Hypericibacter sp. TaxID=2705401 RepID=UPI003D6CA08E